MPNTLAIILSGGAGLRVDGQDKGLLNYQGRPLIEHIIEKLEPQVSSLVLSIHRNQSDYKKLNHNLVLDQSIEHEGPVAGIYSVATRLNDFDRFDLIALCPCDTPFIQRNQIQRLTKALEHSSADLSVAHDGERRQNLHCVFKKHVISSLIEFYKAGGRAMHRWFELIEVVEVDFSDTKNAFINLNSAEQFKREYQR